MYENGYAVEGKGNISTCYYDDDYGLSKPKIIDEEKRDVESLTVEITKEFYDFLYANFKDVFPNKVDLQNKKPLGYY